MDVDAFGVVVVRALQDLMSKLAGTGDGWRSSLDEPACYVNTTDSLMTIVAKRILPTRPRDGCRQTSTLRCRHRPIQVFAVSLYPLLGNSSTPTCQSAPLLDAEQAHGRHDPRQVITTGAVPESHRIGAEINLIGNIVPYPAVSSCSTASGN